MKKVSMVQDESLTMEKSWVMMIDRTIRNTKSRRQQGQKSANDTVQITVFRICVLHCIRCVNKISK